MSKEVFESKKDVAVGKFIMKLCGLYTSPSIVRIVKARKLWRNGHVSRKGGDECIAYNRRNLLQNVPLETKNEMKE